MQKASILPVSYTHLDVYKRQIQSLAEGKELAAILEQRGTQRGVMDLESGECRFVLDDKGVCVDIWPRVQGQAEKMIEQFMLTANQAAAMYLSLIHICLPDGHTLELPYH